MAEAVLQHLVDQRPDAADWQIDSCGTGAWHVGEPADKRTRAVLARAGIHYRGRARQLSDSDFVDFDWLLAMDEVNLAECQARRPAAAAVQLALLRDFDPQGRGPVPDPYYGGAHGFDDVYELVERSCRAFIAQLGPELDPPQGQDAE